MYPVAVVLQYIIQYNTILYNTQKTQNNTYTIRIIQGGSNMTGTNCDLFTHKSVPVIFEPPCT
jgi:hypothetical protein